MTSKEKIRDIKSLINEFYHTEKYEGKLTESARKSWLVFQEYCDDISQALERLETLEKENKELKETIEIRKQMNINLIDFGTKLKQENQDLWQQIENYNHKFAEVERKKCDLIQENEKLKTAIEIMRNKKVNIRLLLLQNLKGYNFLIGNSYQLTQQEYELLKEVLGSE